MKKQAGPQRLGEILSNFLESNGLAARLKHLELYGAWEEIVGPGVLPHTRVAGFAHHKLYVEVDSAAHLHELQTFHKQELLKELQSRVPGTRVLDIVFRPSAMPRR